MSEVYIGLMSGTSLDGVDGVVVAFQPRATGAPDRSLTVLAHAHRPFDAALAGELLALNSPGENELHRAALAGNAVACVYADVVHDLLRASGIAAESIEAIGAHGQTVRHRPHDFDATGYTVQLINAALLAELTGIDVVADLRSRDVAAGGQGAPLVPAFHRAVFGRIGETTAVLNIGGISNLTALQADGGTTGFDCGPGNALMDFWCQRHTGEPFDDAGAWAASGKVIDELLTAMRSEPYFQRTPPKSTGRDLFHPTWLATHVGAWNVRDAQDIQAPLAELTASVCADAVLRGAPGAKELLVCGGGALNTHLMGRLQARLPGMTVFETGARGLPASQVEAIAFAWLARSFVRREPVNLGPVTGARGPRLLGALHPA